VHTSRALDEAAGPALTWRARALQIYHALYYTMPRDRLVEEAEEEDESDAAPPAPPLEPRPSALELLPHSALAPKDSATSLPAVHAKDLPPPPC